MLTGYVDSCLGIAVGYRWVKGGPKRYRLSRFRDLFKDIVLRVQANKLTMPRGTLPEWPPQITEAQRHSLTLLATTYALSHGLIYLPVADIQPPAPTSTIHAPISLFPSPFPRRWFEEARKLQHVYNVLYAKIAMDDDFLDRVMGEDGAGRADEFTGQLWKKWKQLRDENAISQVWFPCL